MPSPGSPSSSSSGSSLAASYGGCGILGWNNNFNSRFALGPEVGRGSFGIVRIAVHRETGKEYAVKILHKCPNAGASASATSNNGTSPSGSAGGAEARGQGGSPLQLTLTAGTSYSLSEGDSLEGLKGQQLASIEREVTAWMAVQVGRLRMRCWVGWVGLWLGVGVGAQLGRSHRRTLSLSDAHTTQQ